jgi:phosphoglycerol geranylgeranyltransferase
MNTILEHLTGLKNGIAVLIDPEEITSQHQTIQLIEACNVASVDFIFIGGSTVTRKQFTHAVKLIKAHTQIPLVIFPGSSQQISEDADGILLLSLISGRNPDFLIGHHIEAAQELAESSLEIIPTSYVLIDGGNQSTVAYVSQTTPIPQHQLSIVYNTVLAGKLLGHKLTFLDAGSGAKNSVSREIIAHLNPINTPILVGGGIKTIDEIEACHRAGAQVVVIGNALEKDIDFMLDIFAYKKRTTTLNP